MYKSDSRAACCESSLVLIQVSNRYNRGRAQLSRQGAKFPLLA